MQTGNNMLLSGRIYLSTIYRLKKQGGRVRSVEVARQLGYTKPSISRAINNFAKEGYLTVESGGILTLTKQGEKEAADIVKRQDIIAKFLVMTCDVTPEKALTDATGMEIHMSRETFRGMKNFIKQVEALQSESGE
ncbi:MAG: metal-dependent transcriptional regulator [Lachnospiraceae bacterium]|nr:metal-dependent transcriptional regulator [Lachnospiraceae bacterium]